MPNALIIRTAGTNCDLELAHAFKLAGAAPQRIHLNRLIEDPVLLEPFELIAVPGGFSYGDDIAAGRIFANRLRHTLIDAMRAAIERGTAIIGICNGFQVLVKMGLLPDPELARQTATLADNRCGRFIDRWVRLEVPQESVCVWTRGLDEFELPIAHGEGRFVPESPDALQRWIERGQVAVRYATDDNPNGSTSDVAGVCDPSGLVLGLMPHPERYVDATHHPSWSSTSTTPTEPSGLRLIANAVRHVGAKAAAKL